MCDTSEIYITHHLQKRTCELLWVQAGRHMVLHHCQRLHQLVGPMRTRVLSLQRGSGVCAAPSPACLIRLLLVLLGQYGG